jgi:biopolymer transport protein ExbD
MSFETSEHDDDVMHEINMTPLVDVMLVLLIIFIITIPAVHHVMKVQLPQLASHVDVEPAKPIRLSIDAQGRYFLNEKEVDPGALEQELRVGVQPHAPPLLYIQADRQVVYDKVANALATAQRAGLVKIGFVTEPAKL